MLGQLAMLHIRTHNLELLKVLSQEHVPPNILAFSISFGLTKGFEVRVLPHGVEDGLVSSWRVESAAGTEASHEASQGSLSREPECHPHPYVQHCA